MQMNNKEITKHFSIIHHEEVEILTIQGRDRKHNQEQEDLICPAEKTVRILMVFNIHNEIFRTYNLFVYKIHNMSNYSETSFAIHNH